METTRSLDLVALGALAIALDVTAGRSIVAVNKARCSDCKVASLRRAIRTVHVASAIRGTGTTKR